MCSEGIEWTDKGDKSITIATSETRTRDNLIQAKCGNERKPMGHSDLSELGWSGGLSNSWHDSKPTIRYFSIMLFM